MAVETQDSRTSDALFWCALLGELFFSFFPSFFLHGLYCFSGPANYSGLAASLVPRLGVRSTSVCAHFPRFHQVPPPPRFPSVATVFSFPLPFAFLLFHRSFLISLPSLLFFLPLFAFPSTQLFPVDCPRYCGCLPSLGPMLGASFALSSFLARLLPSPCAPQISPSLATPVRVLGPHPRLLGQWQRSRLFDSLPSAWHDANASAPFFFRSLSIDGQRGR